MNILSISQSRPQTSQSDFSLDFSSESQKTSQKSSFADYLRDARRDDEKVNENVKMAETEDKEISVESEKIAANNEEIDSSETKNKTDESKTVKEEKSEKLSKKTASNEDKHDERLNDISKSTLTDEKTSLQGISGFQNAEISQFDEIAVQNQGIIDGEVSKVETDSEIDDKMLAWLVASTRDCEDEDISPEDFAALIDAAVEFIPGNESDEEKLLNAQNMAVNDPQFFLEAVASAESESFARGAAKSELALDSDVKTLAKDSDKKRGAKLSVHDLRTRHLFAASEQDNAKIASDKIVQKAAEKKELSLSMQKQAEGNVQMTMELAGRAQENITSSSAQAAGANGSNFQAMLSNAVQENAPEFVKAGNIVLKDNNQGTINLVLRPEGLGNVKISLNLDDKNLSAQITVQTKEAMDAFRESISSLKQAFTESGFETGSFDLNFSNNGSQDQGFAQNGSQEQNQAGLLAHKTYSDFVTAANAGGEAASSYGDSSHGINIVA